MTDKWLYDQEIDGIPVARRSGMRKGMFDLKSLEDDGAIQLSDDEEFRTTKSLYPREYADLEWNPDLKF